MNPIFLVFSMFGVLWSVIEYAAGQPFDAVLTFSLSAIVIVDELALKEDKE